MMSKSAFPIAKLAILPLAFAASACAHGDRGGDETGIAALRAFCVSAERGSVPPSDLRGLRRTSAAAVNRSLRQLEQRQDEDSIPDAHFAIWADSGDHETAHVVCRDLAGEEPER